MKKESNVYFYNYLRGQPNKEYKRARSCSCVRCRVRERDGSRRDKCVCVRERVKEIPRVYNSKLVVGRR